MRRIYRGYVIDANREKNLGGWETIFYTIKSLDETETLEDNFYESEDTLLDFVNSQKQVIDDHIDNPDEEE